MPLCALSEGTFRERSLRCMFTYVTCAEPLHRAQFRFITDRTASDSEHFLKEQTEKMARCVALTKQNKQCKNNAKEGSSFCNVHQTASYCTGVTLKGEPCKAQRFQETLFCKQHQHQTESVSTDCELLRMPDLLETRRDAVLQYRHSKDAYTRRLISDTPNLNLDHVVELHFLRDCYDLVPGDSDEKKSLLSFVKTVANKTHNLNFTSQAINQAKHCAVKHFCEDFKSNQCHADGFQYYLSQTKLDEDVRSSIMDQTYVSMDYVIYLFNDHEAILEHVNAAFEKMVL